MIVSDRSGSAGLFTVRQNLYEFFLAAWKLGEHSSCQSQEKTTNLVLTLHLLLVQKMGYATGPASGFGLIRSASIKQTRKSVVIESIK